MLVSKHVQSDGDPPSRSLRHSAAVGIKWLGLLAATNTVLQVGQFALLARLLDKLEFGLVAIVTVVVGFSQAFADMGLTNALIQRQRSSKDELSSLFWLNCTSGAAVALIVGVLGPLLASIFTEPRLQPLILIASASFLIVPFGSLYAAILQRDLQFERGGKIELAGAFVYAGSSVAMAYVGLGASSLVWALVLSTLIRTLLYAAQGVRTWRPTWHFRWADLREYVAFGAFQAGSRAVEFISQNVDNLMVGKLLGTGPLGVYSVSYTLMSKPIALLTPLLNRVAFPVMSKMQDDDERLRRAYLKGLEIICAVAHPFFLGIALCADTVVRTLLGDEWLEAIPLVRIFALLGMIYALHSPLSSLLQSKGKTRTDFAMNLVLLGLKIGAVAIGSQWGLQGVAWSLVALAAVALIPVDMALCASMTGLAPLRYLQEILVGVATCIPLGGTLWATMVLTRALPTWPRLFLLIVVGIMVYGLTLAVGRRGLLHELRQAISAQNATSRTSEP